ncbi:S1C family serine protease, partial [bacterium]|nr:S1C family serine protease [bacterium]
FPASGVVWKKQFVITTDHSLPRTSEVQIRTASGEMVTGVIAGRDPSTDVAIIQTSKELQPLEFSETQLKAGQLAVILGRANGGRLLSVLTMISGTDSTYKNWRGGTFDQFIRLDSALFPGFSGSALLLPNGKITGINTSAFSRHFGLTIPGSNIQRLVDRVITKGSIGRPYLGLMMQPVRLPEKFRKEAGTDIGLLLIGTENGSPAEQAGLAVGDIVVGLNGKTVNSIEELHEFLSAESIGTEIKVTILRGGKIENVQTKVGERPLRQ